MAGLLDFLNSPDAQLGIGLLAAGGPTTDPNQAGIGQRIQGAMNGMTAQQQVAMRAKLMQSQIDENATQDLLRKAQLAQQAQRDAYYMGGAGLTGASPANTAAASGATSPGVGSAPAGAAPVGSGSPAAGDRFSQWSAQYGIPRDALVNDYLTNGGKGIAEMLAKAGGRDMQVSNGYAYDKNKQGPGFLPQLNTSQNGQTSMVRIGPDGLPVVSAPEGALKTYDAYQGASNRSAADYQGEKVYDTDPTSKTYGTMVLKPRSTVLQPQGGGSGGGGGGGGAVRGNFTGTPEQVLDQINASPVPEPVKAQMRQAYANQVTGNNPAFNAMGTGALPPGAGMPSAPGAAVVELSPAQQSLNNANKEQAGSLASQTGPMLKDSADTAVSAVQSVQAAQRLQQAIGSDKTLSGPTATLRLKGLQIASMLGVPGKDDAEKIANTRQAIQEMAKLTLEGRQQMKGQGAVTNQESALAERATSGSIDDLTGPEISQLAAAAERSARFKYGVHQSRVDKIAKDNPAAASQMGAFAVPPLPEPMGNQKPAAPALPSLPTPNASNRGKTATGSDGSKWQSNGLQWSRVQ